MFCAARFPGTARRLVSQFPATPQAVDLPMYRRVTHRVTSR